MKIIAVGKIKKDFIKEGLDYYLKQLPKITIEEIKQSTPAEEGKLILKSLKEGDYVISLAIEGQMMDSIEFSQFLDDTLTKNPKIVFIIGCSLGLSSEVLKRSDAIISFSKFTFPHELFRLILVEQLYRAHSIKASKPYHK